MVYGNIQRWEVKEYFSRKAKERLSQTDPRKNRRAINDQS